MITEHERFQMFLIICRMEVKPIESPTRRLHFSVVNLRNSSVTPHKSLYFHVLHLLKLYARNLIANFVVTFNISSEARNFVQFFSNSTSFS